MICMFLTLWILCLGDCDNKGTADVKIRIGESPHFTEEEIAEVINLVKKALKGEIKYVKGYKHKDSRI